MGNVEKADTVKQFLQTLAENNRLGILEGICDKFAVLMGAVKGELEMVVQSASVSSHRCVSDTAMRLPNTSATISRRL